MNKLIQALVLSLLLVTGMPNALAATTVRVSVGSNGAQANKKSFWPALSADGRYVAFESYASNLVPGDTNKDRDIFVHDRMTG